MRNYLKKWFQPTRLETNGSIILATISIVSFCLPNFLPIFLSKKPTFVFSEFQIEIQHFLDKKLPDKVIASNWNSPKRSVKKEVNISLFKFNPNEASKEDFIRLGLSQKVAQIIVNYRNKGGKFFKKEDFSKIYGLRKEDFERLSPYMILNNNEPKKKVQIADSQLLKEKEHGRVITQKVTSKEDKTSDNFFVDVNKATIEEWQQLKGIGAFYSKRIVKFREALGGFVSINQIAETYHFPDSTFQKIKPFLKWSPLIQKININTVTFEELKSHPYLKYKQAKGIIAYRTNHGNYTNIEDLKKVGGALKMEDLKKIEPYLNFD